ncbi:hypothetical protein GRJ2_000915400 [Grus japonensis]|uniref:Uncharacterized protein n=1 Tax=Grus japonensis TaxID=30415 RepID=A0ABC9WGX6_GRUJA
MAGAPGSSVGGRTFADLSAVATDGFETSLGPTPDSFLIPYGYVQRKVATAVCLIVPETIRFEEASSTTQKNIMIIKAVLS